MDILVKSRIDYKDRDYTSSSLHEDAQLILGRAA